MFLGPVTKHISDSFNLPGGLAGLRPPVRSGLSAFPFGGEANYRTFDCALQGGKAKNFLFFLLFSS